MISRTPVVKMLDAVCLAALALCPHAPAPRSAAADKKADVVVYSGSEAGFTAALQAARMGKSVILIEPTGHPGGMAVEGISGDIKHGNVAVISGIAKEFYRNVAEHYGRPDPSSRSGWRPAYEPHAAEEVIERMLAKAGERISIIRKVRLREGPGGVEKDGTRIVAIVLEDGTRIQGRAFVDASIEGHLLHFAGVSTATGREANAKYGETLNGIRAESRHRNFTVKVDPYVVPGDPASGLIATIQPGELGEPGAADRHIMGFCFRLCLTKNADNVIPVEKPDNSDPRTYEIYRRYLAAGGRLFRPSGRLPGGKTDLGSWHDLSANLYGMNATYPDGDYAEQRRVVQLHRDFTQGLIWFLQNDPAVPEETRRQWSGWGLCRDEFADNGGWPRRLYIRSARRMVSDFVHTERHTRWPDPEVVDDTVAVAWWPPDMHHARRIVRNGAAYNEGFVYGDGGWSPFGISYRALVPRRGECTNLITPTCPSSSYVAYGAIRILCTFMMLGQSAGTAAAMAADADVDMQDVPYTKLKRRLSADGLVLQIPEDAHWDGKRDISYGSSRPAVRREPMRQPFAAGAQRCTGRFKITGIPEELAAQKLALWTVARGDHAQPGRSWKLQLKTPAVVYLLAMDRGDYRPPDDWAPTDWLIEWATADGKRFRDRVYVRRQASDTIDVPAHTKSDGFGYFGIPHALLVPPGGR